MTDILTITLNPAIDKTYVVNDLVPEHKLRCANPVVEAGGGGINVSKGLNILGTLSTAVFFAGGRNGEVLQEMLQRERIECLPIAVDGETRESVVIIDQATKKEFRIVVDGPEISNSTLEQIIQHIERVRPSFLIASGSVPKGLANDVYALLAKSAKAKGVKFILDTSGDPLRNAVEEGVYLLKPNLKELSILSGVKSLQFNEVPNAAGRLIKDGKAEVVVVSMSSSGALLITKEDQFHVPSPGVEQRSTVGAGDSMVSGMVWGLLNKKSLKEMTCWGVACGSAATMNSGTQLFKKQDAEKLFSWISEKVAL